MNNQAVSISELSRLLISAWEHVVEKDAASKIGLAITRTALRNEHHINVIQDAIDDLQKALLLRAQMVEIVRKGVVRSYDLCGMPGITFMPTLTEMAVTLAKQHGIGVVTLKNSGGVDTLGTWLLQIPNQECIGLFIWNGGSYTTVPFGSVKPFFGTNPIAYAIPTSEEPILLDMSTSEIPFMDLMQAIRAKTPLPERAGLNELGEMTIDAERVYDINIDSDVKLLPMGGGYKGSAIMLLIEIATGALIDSFMAREATSATQIPEEFGGILVAIDIGSFTSPRLFKQRVTKMLNEIRASKSAAGFTDVRIPGDRSTDRERDRLISGQICLDEPLLSELKRLAGQSSPHY